MAEFVPGLGNSGGGGGGSGTVTSVSVSTANGVSGTVANATTTPAITLSLAAITPTSISTTVANTANVAGLTIVQNDTTNNPKGISVTNAGTGNSVYIDANGNTGTTAGSSGAFFLDNTGNTGTGGNFYTNGATVGSTGVLFAKSDNAASTGPVARLDQDGTGPALKINQNGNVGTTSGTSGALVINNTGNTSYGIQVYSNVGAGAGALVRIEADNAAFDQPTLHIKNLGTSGAAASIRLDGVAPQIEFVETDQVAPKGKWELEVQGDQFFLNSRNSADNSFEVLAKYDRLADGGKMYLLSGDLDLGTASTLVGKIALHNATNTNTVNIKSGVTSGTYTMTLPLAVASAGQVLTDAAGDGVLSWSTNGVGDMLKSAYDAANVNEQLVGLTASQTLTNKTLTSALVTTKISPTTNDGAPLGDVTHNFSDLFLAAGGVVNWNNGAVTITEGTTFLTLAGGGLRTTAVGIGVNKANSASIALEVKADSTFTQGMRVESDLSTRLAFSSFVTADAQVRFTFRTDGVLGWGDGTSVSDTNLYRSAVDTLKTDDAFIAGGTITGSNLSGTNTGDQTNITGNAGTVTVVDAGGDTTMWVMLAGSQTGSIAPMSDAGITFNATNNALTVAGLLTAGQFSGDLVGNISGNASTVTTNANLTGPITSVGNATAVAAQTGTGTTFVMQASPTLTTPIIGVATGTSLALSAATSLTIGTASSLAGSIVFQNATNANTITLKSGVTGTSYTLTMPLNVASAGQVLTDAAGNGVLSWTTAGGFSYGSSVSGTTADGLTITLSNSSDDAAGALKLIAGNTQANQPVLANLQIGTSANVQGILVQGTGGVTGGAAGTGLVHMTLWANTATSLAKVLTVASETSYTETLAITANGTIVQTAQTSPAASTIFHQIVANNTNANLIALMDLELGTSAKAMGLLIKGTGSTTGGAVGTGNVHMTLWANTSASANAVISAGNGTSYTESFQLLATGKMTLTNASSSYTIKALNTSGTSATDLAAVIDGSYNNTGQGSSNGIIYAHKDVAGAFSVGLGANISQSGTVTACATAAMAAVTGLVTRTHVSNTTITDSDGAHAGFFSRTNASNAGSANYTVSSPTFIIEQIATQTSGTLTVSGDVLLIKAPSIASFTGNVLKLTSGGSTIYSINKAGTQDISGIAAGTANFKITATSDTPATTWTTGATTTNPSAFIEILDGATVRYIPLYT